MFLLLKVIKSNWRLKSLYWLQSYHLLIFSSFWAALWNNELEWAPWSASISLLCHKSAPDGHWAGLVEVWWDEISENCFTLLLFMLNIVTEMSFTVLSDWDCQNRKTDRCYYTVQNYQKERHFLPNKIDHMLAGKGKSTRHVHKFKR